MPHRLARYDQLIAEGRAEILRQLFRIMAMEADGADTGAAEGELTACMGNLAVHRCVRETIAEGRRLAQGFAVPRDGLTPALGRLLTAVSGSTATSLRRGADMAAHGAAVRGQPAESQAMDLKHVGDVR